MSCHFEIMSTSDNVLRAGLTSKLVDVDEFLAVARCVTRDPDVLRADAAGRYPARADQFSIRRFSGGAPVDVTGPAVVVATDGVVDVDGCALRAGHAAFVPDAPWARIPSCVRRVVRAATTRKLPSRVMARTTRSSDIGRSMGSGRPNAKKTAIPGGARALST